MKLRRVDVKQWNPSRLGGLMRAWEGKRVLVIGDVGVDRYTRGSVERISPEAPVPILAVHEKSLKLGLAANVADNVHALGGVPLLIGVVGRDIGASELSQLLRDRGISGAGIVRDGSRRTTFKERLVGENQQLLRVDYETSAPISASCERQVLARFRKLLRKCDAVIVEDYAKGMLSARALKQIFTSSARAGKLVALDPNRKTPTSHYVGAGFLTPNSHEAESLAGERIVDEKSLKRVAVSLLRRLKAKHVIITRGKDGMALLSRGAKDMLLIPTFAREVYDVSGAGDTVIATMSLVAAAGGTMEEAVVLGNLAASVEVSKRGTATVTREEIGEALKGALKSP